MRSKHRQLTDEEAELMFNEFERDKWHELKYVNKIQEELKKEERAEKKEAIYK